MPKSAKLPMHDLSVAAHSAKEKKLHDLRGQLGPGRVRPLLSLRPHWKLRRTGSFDSTAPSEPTGIARFQERGEGNCPAAVLNGVRQVGAKAGSASCRSWIWIAIPLAMAFFALQQPVCITFCLKPADGVKWASFWNNCRLMLYNVGGFLKLPFQRPDADPDSIAVRFDLRTQSGGLSHWRGSKLLRSFKNRSGYDFGPCPENAPRPGAGAVP